MLATTLLLFLFCTPFLAVFVGTGVGGAGLCLGGSYAYLMGHVRVARVVAVKDDICRAARAGRLQRGDGVPLHDSDTTEKELRQLYHKLAVQFHPDKTMRSGVPVAVANEQFACIAGAYHTVLASTRRRRCFGECRLLMASDPSFRTYYDCRNVC